MVNELKIYPQKENSFFTQVKALNFVKCKCRIIVPLSDKPEICGCGRHVDDHETNVENQVNSYTNKRLDKWSRDECTIESGPTDAYGSISFLGASEIISQYMRLHYKSDLSNVIKLLFDKSYWNLPKPKLIISVTGGAQLKLKSNLKESFSKGLVKVASTTNALILTGGSYNGCMKLVGEAFKNNAASISMDQRITLLGVANWGSVSNNDKLVHILSSESDVPVEYELVKTEKYKKTHFKNELLDPNHTHFLLVDDGAQKFGGEVEFKADLEAEVARYFKIPIVGLVIGGGPRTINHIHESILKGSPCVLLEGSGDSADIISFALKKFDEMKRENNQVGKNGEFRIGEALKGFIREKFKARYDKKMPEIEKMVEETEQVLNPKLRSLLTVCRPHHDLDVAILQGLLQAVSETGGEGLKERYQAQLKLAMTWNRVDIARDFILTDELKDKIGSLDEFMFEAILDDKLEFVKMFMDNGFSLKGFVTYRLMLKLYNCIPHSSLFYRLLVRFKTKLKLNSNNLITFRSVGKLIELVSSHLYVHKFTQQPFSDLDDEQSRHILENTTHFGRKLHQTIPQVIPGMSNNATTFDTRFNEPEHELFLYCILLNKPAMARHFCEAGDNSVCSYLLATIIFNSYASFEKEEGDTYRSLAKDFDNLAYDILDTYYTKNEERARFSLLRQVASYGNCTSMQVAVAAGSIRDQGCAMMAHPCFQNILTNIWYRNILPDVSNKTIALAVVMPFLAPFIVRFKKRKIESGLSKQSSFDAEDPIQQIEQPKKNELFVTKNHAHPQQGFSYQELTKFQKLDDFLVTPCVKFFYHSVFYLLFLILFSYVLLCDFYMIGQQNKNTSLGLLISIPEILLIIWVFTFALEKVLEFTLNDRKMLRGRDYRSPQNIFDAVAIFIFIIAEILRFIPDQNCYLAARILLCINIILWFIKSMYVYKILRSVGPKFFMIQRMLRQLMYFLLIVVMFMFAFGVSTQSLMYHNQELNPDLLKNVFFPAYFIIGGEYYTYERMLFPSTTDCKTESDAQITDKYTQNDCPESVGSIVSIIIYVIYLIFLNILLVNLLIAIFNNTYQEIEAEANKIWKSGKYNLVHTFYFKPRLPPPLIIISYFMVFVRFVYLKCHFHYRINQGTSGQTVPIELRSKTTKPVLNQPNIGFVCELNKAEQYNLIRWETYNTDEYVYNSEQKLKEQINTKLDTNSDKLDALKIEFDMIIENQNLDLNEKIADINTSIMELIKVL